MQQATLRTHELQRALAGAGLLSSLLAACVGLRPAEAQAVYLAEQLRCVDQATTRAEADECRAAVRQRWGITETVRDAGGDR